MPWEGHTGGGGPGRAVGMLEEPSNKQGGETKGRDTVSIVSKAGWRKRRCL